MGRAMGELEQAVLFALVSLGDGAYGARIRREIEARTGQTVGAGGIYTVLDRLERQGLVASWIGEPTAERGGRRRKHYRVRPDGARLLHDAHERMRRMSEGLGERLADLAGAGG